MGANDHDVNVLNSLITTTIDSKNGFEEAAKDADNPQFKSMFSQFADERRACVNQLQQAVRQLGGDPEDDGSAKAAAHRTWLNLKDAVTGKDDKQVVEEVENGEDYIKNKYETALEDDKLSVQARSVITEAFTSVRQGHDRASQLKQVMRSAS